MSSISSVDASVYSGLIESISRDGGYRQAQQHVPASSNAKPSVSNVDLSHYYDGVATQDLIATVGANVAESAEALDNAMVSALENGLSVNDAVNIQLAKTAYEANCEVLKTTFKLAI